METESQGPSTDTKSWQHILHPPQSPEGDTRVQRWGTAVLGPYQPTAQDTCLFFF